MKIKPEYLTGMVWTLLMAAVLFLVPACSQEPEQPERPAERTVERPAEQKPASGIESLSQADILKVLHQSKGKVVLLLFWATWCDPCRAEIGELMKLRGEYTENELLILGISVDREPAALNAFVKRRDFNYPVYLGTDAAVQFFRVQTVPRLLIYDKNGELKVNAEGLVDTAGLREVVDNLLAG